MSETEYKKWNIEYDELELKEEIGRGAFGVVHIGKWRKSKVVVKKLFRQRMGPKEIANFKSEADIIM